MCWRLAYATNTVVCWHTAYMELAVGELRAASAEVDAEDRVGYGKGAVPARAVGWRASGRTTAELIRTRAARYRAALAMIVLMRVAAATYRRPVQRPTV